VRAAIALTGGITAFYAATCACCQRDLKRILAYSTISQIGYMVLGVGAGALTGATFHLLTHAFFKALLFLGAGCVITALHHRQDIFRMGGLRARLPGVYWPFLAGALCLAGFPLTGGFFSKDAILAGVAAQGGPLYGGLLLLGLITALLTSFYTFRMVFVVFHGEQENPLPREEGGHPALPKIMTLALVPLALLGLCGGMLNLPSYLGHQGILDGFLGHIPGFGGGEKASRGGEIVLQVVAAIISLSGLGLAWFRYTGSRRAEALAREEAGLPGAGFLLNGWRLDNLYGVLIINPFKYLARFFWKRGDEAGIDGALNGLACLIVRLGGLPADWCTGRVATSLFGLAGGVCVVLAYLVWVTL
jgi:NADH-quinone oxidoreductase subunit L